jgi:hypothetical protein
MIGAVSEEAAETAGSLDQSGTETDVIGAAAAGQKHARVAAVVEQFLQLLASPAPRPA